MRIYWFRFCCAILLILHIDSAYSLYDNYDKRVSSFHGDAQDEESIIRIITPSEPLTVTQFPCILGTNMVNLTRTDHVIQEFSEEFTEDLSKISIAISNGTIQDLDTYPGLWIQTKSSTQVVITGSHDDIRLFLEDGILAINPPMYNWVGSSSVRLTLMDEEENYVTSAMLQLEFNPEIDFMLAISPRSIEMEEDGVLSFAERGISLSFEHEMAVRTIDCHFEAKHGRIQEDAFNETVEIASIISAFETIVYQPKENFHGVDMISFQCKNNLGQVHKSTISMTINPVNDMPKIVTPPKTIQIDEDVPFRMGAAGIYIIDKDMQKDDEILIAVDLKMNIGEIILPDTAKLGGIRTLRDSTSHVRLVGSLDRVNIAIQFLDVQFPSDWFGSDSLSIHCSDSMDFAVLMMQSEFVGDWVTTSVAFTVRSVNDAPQIIVMDELFTGIKQGDHISFDRGGIQVTDVDGKKDEMYRFRWELIEENEILPGRFAANENESMAESNLMAKESFHNKNSTFEGSGKLSEINDMKGFKLILNEKWSGKIRGLTLQVIDSFGDSVIEQVEIPVDEIFEIPQLVFTHNHLETKEDETIALSGVVELVLLNGFRSVDDDERIFKLSAKSQMGGLVGMRKIIEGLSLPNHSDIFHIFDKELLLVGPIRVLNTALGAPLFYTPPKNLDTNDVLTFSLYDDLETFHRQGDLHIDIEEVNDAPTMEIPTILKTANKDGSQAMTLRGLQVFDDSTRYELLQVNLELVPAHVGDIMFGSDSVNELIPVDLGRYVINGTLNDLNEALSTLIVRTNLNFVGQGGLYIEILDTQGASSEERVFFEVDNTALVPQPVVLNSTMSVFEDELVDIGNLVTLNLAGAEMSSVKKVEMIISAEGESSSVFDGSFLFHVSDIVGGLHFPHHDYREGPNELFIVRGSLEYLNKILHALRLEPPRGFYGEILVRVDIYDFPKVKIFTEEIFVRVIAIDNAPVITWNGVDILEVGVVMKLFEDTSLSLKGFDIADIDNTDEPITLTLSPRNGRLCYPKGFQGVQITQSTNGTSFADSGSVESSCFHAGTLKLKHNIVHANDLLSSIAYRPLPNWFGTDFIQIAVQSQSELVSSSFQMFVEGVSDVPKILILNSTFSIEQDEMLIIEGISVEDNDVDNEIHESKGRCTAESHLCTITVEFEALDGTISFLNPNRVTNVVTSSKTIMKGHIDLVNAALQAGILYEPNKFFHGVDHLKMIATDFERSSSTTHEIEILVEAKRLLPYIILPERGSILHLREDTLGLIGMESCSKSRKDSPAITCESIQISYLHNPTIKNTNEIMKVSLSWRNGSFHLPRLQLIHTGVVNTTNNSSVEGFHHNIYIEDKMDSVNWILESIQVKGNQNFNTMGKRLESLYISVENKDGILVEETLHMAITPVNDPPVIEIESGLFDPHVSTGDLLSSMRIGVKAVTIEEDSSFHLTGISIRDVDSDSDIDLLELSMKSYHGYFYLPLNTFARVWIKGDKDLSQELTLRSTVNEINKILDQVVYIPNRNFFGNDKIKVSVSDLGTSDDENQPRLSDEAIIPIEIRPVPDIPVFEGPDYLRMQEDTTTIIKGRILHPNENANISISLECNNGGAVGLHSVNDLKLSIRNGNINGTGSVFAWNRAFERLQYTPPRNFNTDNDRALSVIRFTASEFIEKEESETSIYEIFVRIDGSPDPHFWLMDGMSSPYSSVVEIGDTIEVLEDTSTSLSISLLDDDVFQGGEGKASRYSVQMSATFGTINLKTYNGIFFQKGSPKNSLLHFDATFGSINDALEEITYTPASNFNGNDVINLFASDRSNFKSTAKIPIFVVPQIDVPVVKTPMIIECEEGVTCDLQGFLTLEDPDFNSKLIIEIQSEVAMLSFGGIVAPSKLLRGALSGDTVLILEGSGSDLNKILSNLVYVAKTNTAPSIEIISLEIKFGDGTPASKSEVPVFVRETRRSKPFIRYDEIKYHDDDTCPSSHHFSNSSDKFCFGYTEVKYHSCMEDSDCPFGKFSVSGDNSAAFDLKLFVQYGSLFFSGSVNGIQIHSEGRHGSRRIVISGKLEHLNKALISLTYTPDANFMGKDKVHLQISASTDSHDFRYQQTYQPVLHELTVDIIVSGTPDTMKLLGPREVLFVKEDEYMPINGISLNYIPNDNNYNAVQVDLKSTNGNFLFNNFPYDILTIIDKSASSENNPRLPIDSEKAKLWTDSSICGNIESIANMLSSVSFIGDRNFNSANGDYASVNVAVYRRETCDLQLPHLSDEDYEDFISILVHVHSVNDSPEISMETFGVDHLNNEHEMTIDEDHKVNLPTVIADVDSGIMKVDLRTNGFGKVSVSHGRGHFTNVFFIEGDGNGDYFDSIVFKGTLEAVNEYLQNLYFVGKENYNGDDSILFIEAQDNFGGISSVQIKITTNPVQDYLQLWLVADSRLVQPIVKFTEEEIRNLGRDWLEAGDAYMESLMQNGQHQHQQNHHQRIRSLSGPRMFTVSNGDNDAPLQSNICVKISVDDGHLQIEHLDGVTVREVRDTHHDTNHEIVYVGTIDRVNDASETILYQAPDESGNVSFHVEITREVCGDNASMSLENEANCLCDFEWSEGSGNVNITVTPKLPKRT